MKFTSDKSSYSNYHDVAKKRLHFFLLLIALGAFFVIGYMIVTGNEAQVYKDVISEWTAWDSSNKSAERYLIYILSIFGAFTYIIYFVWTKMKYKDVFQPDSNMTEEKTTSDFVILLLVVSGIYYFIYSGTNPFIITAIICVVLFLLIDKTLVVPGLCAFFWSAYAINALYKIYVSFGGDKQFHAMISSFLSFLLVMVMSIGNFKKRNLLRGILISQIMIPFLLLIYIESKYKYGEEILTLHIPYKVHCFIGMLIIIFLLEAIYLLWKHWNQFSNIGNIISYGSCIAVMAFNRFSGTGAIISSDDHHPYENIIAFSQIFKLGQKPFDEYIPVSGMYSLVQGFFLDFFGHNKMEYYYLTQNIFYLCIIVVIVVLLKRQINGIYLLMISLIYSVLDYNRFAFVLPVMLLLSWPKLIEKKNTWLKAWFLTSYLQGLYYPVYGAAVCLGFLPMGIWQIIRYIKSGELLKAFKKGPFWIGWFLCCIPVIGGIPYLLGTFRHTLAMGGQTVCADGTSRFGQKIPDDFFNYINSVTIRLAIYYIFSFLILASIVWACIAICLEIGILQIKGKSLMLGDPIPVFITLACAITLMVSFSFTVIRLEIGDLYSRNKGIVNAVFVIFIILVGRYLQKGGLRRFVLGFSIFIVAVYK